MKRLWRVPRRRTVIIRAPAAGRLNPGQQDTIQTRFSLADDTSLTVQSEATSLGLGPHL